MELGKGGRKRKVRGRWGERRRKGEEEGEGGRRRKVRREGRKRRKPPPTVVGLLAELVVRPAVLVLLVPLPLHPPALPIRPPSLRLLLLLLPWETEIKQTHSFSPKVKKNSPSPAASVGFFRLPARPQSAHSAYKPPITPLQKEIELFTRNRNF